MPDNQEQTFPFDATIFDQCTGEDVVLSGEIHEVISTNTDANGNFHSHENFNFENVSGVGLVTGTEYHLTGQFSHDSINESNSFEETITTTSNLISQGPMSNDFLHVTF